MIALNKYKLIVDRVEEGDLNEVKRLISLLDSASIKDMILVNGSILFDSAYTYFVEAKVHLERLESDCDHVKSEVEKRASRFRFEKYREYYTKIYGRYKELFSFLVGLAGDLKTSCIINAELFCHAAGTYQLDMLEFLVGLVEKAEAQNILAYRSYYAWHLACKGQISGVKPHLFNYRLKESVKEFLRDLAGDNLRLMYLSTHQIYRFPDASVDIFYATLERALRCRNLTK